MAAVVGTGGVRVRGAHTARLGLVYVGLGGQGLGLGGQGLGLAAPGSALILV